MAGVDGELAGLVAVFALDHVFLKNAEPFAILLSTISRSVQFRHLLLPRTSHTQSIAVEHSAS